MVFFYSLLALIGGALFPIQTAINAQLGRALGGALPATIVSFLVGLTALVAIYVLSSRQPFDAAMLRSVPAYAWIGGLLGAAFLGMSVFLLPRLGSGTLLCLVVAGQILTAILIDSFGLFGVTARDLSPVRLAGAALVAIGVVLVRLY